MKQIKNLVSKFDRFQAPAGESQPSVEVDLFASTSKVKILNADSQDVIMEHPLRSLSYIADIGDILVLIAKRKVINICHF